MKFFVNLLFFVGIFGVFAPPVQAAQPLSFDAKIGETSRQALAGYVHDKLGVPLDNMLIAPVDLNNDGLNEFVMKEKNCDAGNRPCRFLVLSENRETIVPLGDIKARRMAIDSQSVQGVRNLLAYTSAINDYEFTVYVWEPLASRYMMAKDR